MKITKESLAEKLMIVWQLAGAARRPAQGSRRRFDPMRGKGRVLAMLKIKDGLSTKELASVTGVRVSSMNEILAKLEAAGLVERMPSEADKRVMLVYLTDAGRAAEVEGAADLDMLAGLSQEELDQLDAILDKMIANAKEALGDERWGELQSEWERRREAVASFMDPDGDGRAFMGSFPDRDAMPSFSGGLGMPPFPGRHGVSPFPGQTTGFGRPCSNDAQGFGWPAE